MSEPRAPYGNPPCSCASIKGPNLRNPGFPLGVRRDPACPIHGDPLAGDPPAPSTRISEKRLREIDDIWRVDATTYRALVAEIRRYRAMLLGLAATAHAVWDADGLGAKCLHCGAHSRNDEDRAHMPHCPAPAFMAEVEAIRAERPKPTESVLTERPSGPTI